ncbi:BCCT family transporter [Marinobacterium aestuariivivens]|uniref:BCCT family transporter n=1 Tax=Marinobacterium aestuariivivens TaxID=1698799 RepID=A0ABW2A0W5_9GAMM
MNNNNLNVALAQRGLYEGLNPTVTLFSKLIIVSLVVYAAVYPEMAVDFLGGINSFLLANFNSYYIYAVSFMLIFCAFVSCSRFGRIKLGRDNEVAEFSFFSWFAMLFSAGMGIGLMFYSIGEPLYHFQNNPDIISGVVAGASAETVPSAMRYTLLHWGLHAWGVYIAAGLAMAYFAYRHNLPLTIRSTLYPLFGERLNGHLGHLVDVIAVVATILGVASTVGTGVSQLVSGIESISGAGLLLDADGKPTNVALVLVLALIMALSILSAVTGVKRGVKWLSHINMYLSFALLGVFVLFGSTLYALKLFGSSLLDYTASLPSLSFSVWDKDSELGQWQTGWTILYWAWWIAFAPFVGLFLARISRGRTIREFVLGGILVPTLMCFIWMAFLGGTALDMETSGQAAGVITETVNSNIGASLFVTIEQLDLGLLGRLAAIASVILIVTYLVTSADSGVLVLNTIMAGGNADPATRHRVIWGLALTFVTGSLMLAGGLTAIQKAMIIGALPFSLVMLLMCLSMLKALLSSPSEVAISVTGR